MQIKNLNNRTPYYVLINNRSGKQWNVHLNYDDDVYVDYQVK